jgi:hypothetical protein
VFDETKGTVVFQTGDLKVTAFLVDHRPLVPIQKWAFSKTLERNDDPPVGKMPY